MIRKLEENNMKILFGINNDDTVKGIAEFYEQKYNEKVNLNEYLPQMRKDIGELLYSYFLKTYNAFPCNSFTCTRDFTKGYENYHISEGYIIEIIGFVPFFT